jgi:hypothetical protein
MEDPKVDKDPDMWHNVVVNQLVAIWNQNRRGYLPANVIGAVNEVRGIWLVEYGDGTLCEEMANKRSWKKPRECLLKGKCICELSPDNKEVVKCVTCPMSTHKRCLLVEDNEDELNYDFVCVDCSKRTGEKNQSKSLNIVKNTYTEIRSYAFWSSEELEELGCDSDESETEEELQTGITPELGSKIIFE